MLHVLLLLIIDSVLGNVTEITFDPFIDSQGVDWRPDRLGNVTETTLDPFIDSKGVDWRPYRFAQFREGFFRFFNNNDDEILVTNATHELVRKHPRHFRRVHHVEDVYLKPYQYSDLYIYEYQVGRLRSRDRWQVFVEYNNTAYVSDPVFCEIDKVDVEDVTILIDLDQSHITVRRPWVVVDEITFSPLRAVGQIATKAAWWK